MRGQAYHSMEKKGPFFAFQNGSAIRSPKGEMRGPASLKLRLGTIFHRKMVEVAGVEPTSTGKAKSLENADLVGG
jgi:hypothetical protein